MILQECDIVVSDDKYVNAGQSAEKQMAFYLHYHVQSHHANRRTVRSLTAQLQMLIPELYTISKAIVPTLSALSLLQAQELLNQLPFSEKMHRDRF